MKHQSHCCRLEGRRRWSPSNTIPPLRLTQLDPLTTRLDSPVHATPRSLSRRCVARPNRPLCDNRRHGDTPETYHKGEHHIYAWGAV